MRDEARPETGRDGRFRSAAARLTVGLWSFAIVTFAISLMIGGAGHFPLWMAVWLGLITVTGLGFTGVLYLTVRSVQRRSVYWRWAFLAAAVVLSALVQSLIDSLLNEGVRLAFGEKPKAWVSAGEFAFNGLLYIWLFGFYTAALELISATERAAAAACQAAEYAVQIAQERELAREAQVQMLRFQLSPHFLFNTLNSISSLVVSGRPALAETMIARLCKFMRASLNPAEASLVPLSRELNAVEAYLEIEAVRFADALDVEIDCPHGLDDALVPTLILQPLVENAVKYALTPSAGMGRLRVGVQQAETVLILSVSDEGAVRPGGIEGGVGIGLENVRRRLAVVYGDLASLDAGPADGGFHARITLPLRRHELAAA